MASRKYRKGKLGCYYVLAELLKRGIEALTTPHFWAFDIFTSHGVILEVKFANIGESKGGSGYTSKRFTFRISPIERSILDFVVLVMNTQKGPYFYIIPQNAII